MRQEQKPLEHRSYSLSVTHALIEAGCPVSFERSSTDPACERISKDSEYDSAVTEPVPGALGPDDCNLQSRLMAAHFQIDRAKTNLWPRVGS